MVNPNTTPKPCVECDLGEIDSLTCESARIKKQAEVTQESLEKLDGYREKFRTARESYSTALATARADVTSATTLLTERWKDLTCHLSQETRDQLEEVWQTVRGEIVECLGPTGCQVGDCTPDSSVDEDETPTSLAGRIQVLRQETVYRDEYFDWLIAQQADLPARAAAAKQTVEDIVSDAKADPPDNDPVRLFVRALVAEWTLKTVYRGFPTVDSYIDCLCRALTCVLRVWKAIVALEGARAEKVCQEDRRKAGCDALVADPVAEVLVRYEGAHPEEENCQQQPQPQQQAPRRL